MVRVIIEKESTNDQVTFPVRGTRLIRFSLLPGRVIKEHSAPSSPVYIVVLEGRGEFSDGEGGSEEMGPNSCIKYELSEKHSVKASDEKLVLITLTIGSQY